MGSAQAKVVIPISDNVSVVSLQLLYNSRLPDLFSTERLLFTLARSENYWTDTLKLVLPHIISVV